MSTSKMSVFSSKDDGKTWARKSLSDEPGEIRTICVNPENKKIIFAGGSIMQDAKTNQAVKKSRLYKSIDGGETWELCAPGIFGQSKNETIFKISYSPGELNTLYAATDNGLYISKDGGINWTAPKQALCFTALVCDPKDKNNIFGGGKNGFWMSKDGGGSWTQMNNGITFPDILSMDYDPVNRIVYAGSASSGLYRLRLN